MDSETLMITFCFSCLFHPTIFFVQFSPSHVVFCICCFPHTMCYHRPLTHPLSPSLNFDPGSHSVLFSGPPSSLRYMPCYYITMSIQHVTPSSTWTYARYSKRCRPLVPFEKYELNTESRTHGIDSRNIRDFRLDHRGDGTPATLG